MCDALGQVSPVENQVLTLTRLPEKSAFPGVVGTECYWTVEEGMRSKEGVEYDQF